MNFKEEYIKAAEEITPDRLTIDRMKANVLNMTRAKRTFPFKTIAAVGGTAAACAVITLAAVHIAPNLTNDTDNMIQNVTAAGGSPGGANNSMSSNYDADVVQNEEWAPEDGVAADCLEDVDESAAIYDETENSAEKSFDSIADAEPSITGSPGSADFSNAAPTAPATSQIYMEAATEEYCWESEWFDSTVDEVPAEDEWAEPNAAPSPEEGPAGEIADTGGAAFAGYTLTIAEDWSECTLTYGETQRKFSNKPSNSFIPEANDPSIPYAILTNTNDNKTYYVALANVYLIIRDENYQLVTVFV